MRFNWTTILGNTCSLIAKQIPSSINISIFTRKSNSLVYLFLVNTQTLKLIRFLLAQIRLVQFVNRHF